MGCQSRCRASCTFFSICPFSQPDAGLQNSASNRKWLTMAAKRALTWRSLPRVEPQEVVLGWSDSADWGFGADAAMGSMPVVAVKPEGQLGGAVVGGAVGAGIGPFAQACLDEALGLPVGFRRVGPGAQMLDFEQAQRLGVAAGSET